VQRLLAFFVGMTAAGTTAVAHAAPRLDYRAASGCPTNAEFVSAVLARGGSVDLGAGSNAEIDVVIERTGDGYRGTARVRNAGQSSDTREVSAPACADVADGLAIVTALASQTGSMPDSAPPTSAVAAPAPAKAATTPNAPATPQPKPSTRLNTLGQFHDEALSVEKGELRIRNDTALTLTGGALFGIVSGSVIPRFDLTIARTNFITTPDGAGHIIGSILRTRWTLLTSPEYRRNDWSARFFGGKASIGGCAQLAYDLEGFVALVCGEVAAGAANVTTKDPTGHVTKDELVGLASAGLELDTRYNWGRHFQVSLTAGGEAWLSPIKATQSDGSEIFRTHPLGAYALAGIGVHFW
jgi:hypothetical protein